MKTNIEKIEVNGIAYIREDSATPRLASLEGMAYVVIRSRDSGCHAGYLAARDGTNVVLKDSRRLWFWSGASTLSQLAMEGVKKPKACKFPCKVAELEVFNICEIILATEEARKSIQGVPVWEQ